MYESNYQKYFKFLKHILKPKFSFHYVAYTTLFLIIIFSVVQLVVAATPNPGHPWSELGDGVFVFSSGQTTTPYTYTFPATNTTVLTTNSAVTIAQGGTGLTTIPAGSVFAANTLDTFSAVTSTSGTKVLTNTDGAITWETATGGSMTWPAGGAGIPNYSGSSSWGTSYTTSGSGTVVALATTPTFTTNITTPLIIGGSAAGSNIIYKSTSGTGTTTGIAHQFIGGTDGGTVAMTLLNNGNVGIGLIGPVEKLDISGKIALDGTVIAYRPTTMTGSLIFGDGGTNLSHTTGSTGYNNTFVGISAGSANTTGYYNTATGYASLAYNNTGYSNTAYGYYSLLSNTTGNNNTASGFQSLYSNNLGDNNTAYGFQSLYSNTSTGGNNTAVGLNSLYANTTGTNNTAIGIYAGRFITNGTTGNSTGTASVFIGGDTRASANGETNQIVIGSETIGNGSNTATIGNTSLLRTYLTGVNLKAGTENAGTAPLKFTSGNLLTTPEAGAIEFDGTHFYGTISSTRYQLDQQTGSGSMVYPGAGIAVSTGSAWGTSITNNSSNWNTAYGWGNHASAGYLTTLAFAGLSDYPANASGALTNDGSGNLSWSAGGGSMTWPAGGAGIPNYSGSSSWGTSYTTSGSGTVVALATTPTFTTNITTPLIIGGSAAGSNIIYKSTSGTGTTTGIAHQFIGGTDGGTVAMTLLNNGNVGIGTSGPLSTLDVRGETRTGDGTNYAKITATGNLSFTGTSSYLVNSNSYAFRAAADTNYGLYFDLTGLNYAFRGASAVTALSVGANSGNVYIRGNVGIGTAATTYQLTMGTGGGFYNQATGAWIDGSDRNYKDHIIDLDKYGLTTLNSLRPVSYIFKSSGVEQIGFIAQEVKEIVPELVSGEDGAMGVNYGGFAPLIVKSVQELDLKLESIAIPVDENNNKTFLERFFDRLISWLGSDTNGLERICVKKSDGTEFCANGDQLEQAVNNLHNVTIIQIPSTTPTCTDTQTLIDGVCKDNTIEAPTCTSPQILVDNVCTDPSTPSPADPTCSDGIQNQDETGIDIGGVCVPDEQTAAQTTPPVSDEQTAAQTTPQPVSDQQTPDV